MQCAVITVSDRCHAGTATDESGPALHRRIAEHLAPKQIHGVCVSDDVNMIRKAVLSFTDGQNQCALILTTGGTGLAPRDVTPEAVSSLFDKPAPNLMELVRLRCYQITPAAFLARGVAGVVNRSLVMTMPGSVRGSTESFDAVLDILPHAIAHVCGAPVDHDER